VQPTPGLMNEEPAAATSRVAALRTKKQSSISETPRWRIEAQEWAQELLNKAAERQRLLAQRHGMARLPFELLRIKWSYTPEKFPTPSIWSLSLKATRRTCAIQKGQFYTKKGLVYMVQRSRLITQGGRTSYSRKHHPTATSRTLG